MDVLFEIGWIKQDTNGNYRITIKVILRASNDGGITFGDKINLSNTNDTDSINAEVATERDNVIVTWWERANATSIHYCYSGSPNTV